MRAIPLLLAGFLVFCFSCSDIEKTCTLKGTDIEGDTILLYKAQDLKKVQVVKIPIINNSVEYSFTFSEIEAYELSFTNDLDSRGYSFIFFPRNGVVSFELDSVGNSQNHKIQGGKNNAELMEFIEFKEDNFSTPADNLYDSLMSLHSSRLLYTEKYYSLKDKLKNETDSLIQQQLRSQIRNLETNENLNPEYLHIYDSRMEIFRESYRWMNDYEEHNYSNLAYYHFLERISGIYVHFIDDEDNYNDHYNNFKKKHPDHPYNQTVEYILFGKENIKIGGNYIDFSAPDLTGVVHTLSNLIKGQIALIDCWYTWCGPCIRKSRTMIPIYNEFHDKGFTIVGIAGEDENIEPINDRINIEKYTWINLVEFRREKSIWDKYNISNKGGGTFLVNPEGKILAINPKAEEVREILIQDL